MVILADNIKKSITFDGGWFYSEARAVLGYEKSFTEPEIVGSIFFLLYFFQHSSFVLFYLIEGVEGGSVEDIQLFLIGL